MKKDLKQIKSLCESFKTEPKVLAIPGRRMKTQILKALTDNGVFPLNLAVKTAKELAYEFAVAEIEKKKLTPIHTQQITEEMINILKSLQETGALLFLDKAEITFGICKAVTTTVLELLDSGYLRGAVGLDKIENANRRADLEIIINTYTHWKKEHNFIDYTDITEIAIAYLKTNKSTYISGYALQSCEFSLLEQDLIASLRLQTNQTDTLATPELSLQARQIQFFDAYGNYNEAKEVLRRIFIKKHPFDSVLVVTPASEPYSQLFYQLMQQYTYENNDIPKLKDLPITFGTGLPLLLSSPAKLLMLLLDWVGSGYRSHALINIFSSDAFDLKTDQYDTDGNLPDETEVFGKLNVINFIKNAGVTWQRRAYITGLENHLRKVSGSEYDTVRTQKCGAWLIGFVNDFFSKIPEETEAGVDVEYLLDVLKSIVIKYKRVYSAFDSQGLSVTLNELNTTIKGRHVGLSEAVEIIKDYMRDIRILCESPAAGRIHLTTYNQAAWIERDNVFVMGMGAENFPGMAIENPLLFDNERDAPPMFTTTIRMNKNIETMHDFLGSVHGNLTCSCASYDTEEIRESYPSMLFNKLRESYPDVKCAHAGFIIDNEDQCLDGCDYWTTSGIKNRALFSLENDIEKDDTTGEPTEPPNPLQMWEPGENIKELKLTATSIVDYMKCKYRYFLKHILNLKEIKEDEFDAVGWLSVIETGNVYHKIIENFIKHTQQNPTVLINIETAVELIRNIAADEISIIEEELPTASSFHTSRQRKEILCNVEKFAKNEVEQASHRKALHTEYSFGIIDDIGINLGDGLRIKAAGKIDRVDKLADGSIEIIDYKTGSTWAFEGLSDPSVTGITEANAQLALYYLALQEVARQSDDPTTKDLANVRRLSYQFLTVKGNYNTISMPVCANAEAVYKTAFLNVCKEIATGAFPPTKANAGEPDTKSIHADCKFCNYKMMCGYYSDG